MNDLISRQMAIDALWKALYEYEDTTEKQFIKSDELDVGDWIHHRIFVQNMNDIDRQTILDLPPAQPEQRWIPVTERLPESSSVWRTEYLATVFCAQWKEKTETMCVQWENTTVRGKRTSRWILNDRLFPKEWKVIAWMPLPEKYSCVDGI